MNTVSPHTSQDKPQIEPRLVGILFWFVIVGMLVYVIPHFAYFFHSLVFALAFLSIAFFLYLALRKCTEKGIVRLLYLVAALWVGVGWWINYSYVQRYAPSFSHVPVLLQNVSPFVVAITPVLLTGASLVARASLPKHVPQQVAPPVKQKDNQCPICRKRDITDSHYQLCATCKQKYYQEIKRVRTQKYRARQAGAEASLTVVEWIQTLQAFHFFCAYCQATRYEVMDHFIPIDEHGGTTKENCVPACAKCNGHKYNKKPEA